MRFSAIMRFNVLCFIHLEHVQLKVNLHRVAMRREFKVDLALKIQTIARLRAGGKCFNHETWRDMDSFKKFGLHSFQQVSENEPLNLQNQRLHGHQNKQLYCRKMSFSSFKSTKLMPRPTKRFSLRHCAVRQEKSIINLISRSFDINHFGGVGNKTVANNHSFNYFHFALEALSPSGSI